MTLTNALEPDGDDGGYACGGWQGLWTLLDRHVAGGLSVWKELGLSVLGAVLMVWTRTLFSNAGRFVATVIDLTGIDPEGPDCSLPIQWETWTTVPYCDVCFFGVDASRGARVFDSASKPPLVPYHAS